MTQRGCDVIYVHIKLHIQIKSTSLSSQRLKQCLKPVVSIHLSKIMACIKGREMCDQKQIKG